MTTEAPRRDSDAFSCPRCGAWAHQVWTNLGVEKVDEQGTHWFSSWQDTRTRRAIFNAGSWTTVVNSSAVAPGRSAEGAVEEIGAWSAATCQRCRDSSVWRDERMMYPATGVAARPHVDMPDDARELFEEAAQVIGMSRRAGAALARAALERLLRTLDPEVRKASLEERVERILPRVSSSLGELLTVIRHAGNKSLHVEEDPDELTVLVLDPGEEEVVDLIFSAINDLVDELISRPKRSADLYAKVPQQVRDRVDRARAKSSAPD